MEIFYHRCKILIRRNIVIFSLYQNVTSNCDNTGTVVPFPD